MTYEKSQICAPGRARVFKLDGKAPESGNVDITVNSGKYGILYRNTLTCKNLLPVRLSCIYTDIPTQMLIMEMENLRLQSGRNTIRVIMKDADGKVAYDRTAAINDMVVKDPAEEMFLYAIEYDCKTLLYALDRSGFLTGSSGMRHAPTMQICGWIFTIPIRCCSGKSANLLPYWKK